MITFKNKLTGDTVSVRSGRDNFTDAKRLIPIEVLIGTAHIGSGEEDVIEWEVTVDGLTHTLTTNKWRNGCVAICPARVDHREYNRSRDRVLCGQFRKDWTPEDSKFPRNWGASPLGYDSAPEGLQFLSPFASSRYSKDFYSLLQGVEWLFKSFEEDL